MVTSSKQQMSDTFVTAVFIILSGGLQDAYTYCCRGGVFANAQTGNIVLLSVHLFQRDWGGSLHYLIPVLAFICGIFVAESIHIHFKCTRRLHWRQIIILLEIGILFSVGFLSQQWNALANALVSFVCALQVQTFHKVRGYSYASTMCIGNLRNGVEALYAYFQTHEKQAQQKAVTYFSVIFFFAAGAAGGSVLTASCGAFAIWFSCALLAVSFCLMFFTQ